VAAFTGLACQFPACGPWRHINAVRQTGPGSGRRAWGEHLIAWIPPPGV
jgi:hypothetical protein